MIVFPPLIYKLLHVSVYEDKGIVTCSQAFTTCESICGYVVNVSVVYNVMFLTCESICGYAVNVSVVYNVMCFQF